MGKRRLKDWLSGYLAYTDHSEPPELFNLWGGITCVAACLQRKCWTEWDSNVYPNMFTVLVGPSGTRKGTALRPVKDFLCKLDIKMTADSVTREMLIKELKSSETMDVFDETVFAHSSLTVVSPEFSVFLGHNRIEFLYNITDWYDCGSGPEGIWSYKTKNMGEDVIKGLWVNLFAATTPEALQSSLPSDAIGGGLTSRIVFVYGDQAKARISNPKKTAEERRMEIVLLDELSNMKKMHGEFKMTPEFFELYDDWYQNQDVNPPFNDKYFHGYNNRRATHIRKLSMIMSASRSYDMQLLPEDFQRALGVLELTEKQMPFVFSGRGRANKVDVLHDVMRMIATKRVLPMSELMEATYKDLAFDELSTMITTLKESLFCREVVQGRTTLIEYIPKEKRGKQL